MKVTTFAAFALILSCIASVAMAGALDPDCTADKAAKHAAEKATVGVSTNRCSPKEAGKDSARKAAGVEDKGPIEKHNSKNDTPVEKAKDAVKK
jgi:hypothetical protein